MSLEHQLNVVAVRNGKDDNIMHVLFGDELAYLVTMSERGPKLMKLPDPLRPTGAGGTGVGVGEMELVVRTNVVSVEVVTVGICDDDDDDIEIGVEVIVSTVITDDVVSLTDILIVVVDRKDEGTLLVVVDVEASTEDSVGRANDVDTIEVESTVVTSEVDKEGEDVIIIEGVEVTVVLSVVSALMTEDIDTGVEVGTRVGDG